jgi:hypothetical protein
MTILALTAAQRQAAAADEDADARTGVPYLTLRFEGRSQAAVDRIQQIVYDALRRYPFVTLPA